MILINNQPIEFKKFTDGSLDLINTTYLLEVVRRPSNPAIEVIANIKNSDDLIGLLLVKGFIDKFNIFKKGVTLELPYVPYMRSDRAMVQHNTIGGLKAIAPLINSLNFDRVLVLDPHSDVTEALINNIFIIEQFEGLMNFKNKVNLPNYDFLVSPDAGALKKVSKCAKALGKPHIEAFKVREINTNKILKTSVNANKEELEGKSVLIVDDIGEYFSTHRELAKMLKEDYGVQKADLYVSHAVAPLNLRISPSSRFNFILEYVDQLFCYNLWSIDNNLEHQSNPKIKFKNIV